MSSALNILYGENVNIHTSTICNHAELGDDIKIGKECTVVGSKNHHVKLGTGTIIGMYVLIDATQADVILDNNVSIAQHNVIVSHWNVAAGSKLSKLFPVKAAPIRIGENTWIGSSCVIAPGVTIGRCSIVASNSYVDSDIPDYSIYGGNPARFIKKIDASEVE
ncbi:MAG: acyltransferase [Cytophagaceae bacterium]|jgi:acetyltransferase-like isoleucine patch superfamily enzyme|nr:acyltransferase [Cytophagaceae bacterium]